MQNGYDLYPSEYNFKYFTRLQSACSYQGKLQTNYAVYLLSFVETPRKFIIVELSIRKLGSSSVLIILIALILILLALYIVNKYIVFTMQTYKKLKLRSSHIL